MRKKTGWESFTEHPLDFFDQVLKLKLSDRSKARLLQVRTGNLRQGLVWREGGEDVVTFAIGLLVWRAMTQGHNSILVGGRRPLAEGWHQHTGMILSKSVPELRRDILMVPSYGLRSVNGAWIMRYDGPLHEDYWESQDSAPEADILFGDFDWINRDVIDEALDNADEAEAMVLMIIGGDG